VHQAALRSSAQKDSLPQIARHLRRLVVATGNATDPALLTASVEKPLRLIGKTIGPESVGVGQKKE